MRVSWTLPMLWLGSLAASLPGGAGAGSLRVSPVRIHLEPGATETLEFRNEGDSAVAVELVARAWSQGADGADLYAPTSELVFYPKIAEVGPGETRVVRLTHPGALASEREASYRLYLRQIPVTRETSEGVAVLLGMSLPVFVGAGALRADAMLERPALARGRVSVAIRNRGGAHVRVNEVVVEARGGEGGPLSSVRIPGWYVLPGALRTFEAKLPAEPCARSRQIRIHADLVGGPLSGELATDPAQCGAP